ncbi:putative toxin-antitoxin system toxin component, PIN family [uncultured Arcticibacterium sp.]|uniref:putative toxin-antitoxin system toxin component, PIN family n=1 Tax=uncultured Arcticibacterium sp. TaxID=2173042 RepID=UPI0030FCC8BA
MGLPIVVIDTNVLIASLSKKSISHGIYKAFIERQFSWLVSSEILNEYEEQLALYFDEDTARFVLEILLTASNTILSEPYFRWSLITEDPDDNKFSDLAISGGANCLITFDKHFNIFKEIQFPSLNIMTPKEFLN